MKDQENDKKKQLLEDMARERGYLPAPWLYMSEKDLGFLAAYNELYTRALTDGKALPIKVRELVAIGILAFRGNADAVYEHAQRALRHGATKQELLEAIESTIVAGGAPTFATGLRALMRIEEDDKK